MCAIKGVLRLDLITDSRLARRQNGTRVKHAGELKGHDSRSTTGQNKQSGQAISLRLRLMTCSNREVESPECPVWMKIDFSHSLHTLL